jgi:hypothetical protein
MANIAIAVINATSGDAVLTDADARAAVAALQQQVRADFAPVWGTDADLTFIARGQGPPSDVWWLVLVDTADAANAGGYHDLTSEGLPLGKVFVKTEQDGGYHWTAAASRELLEMLGDPDLNLWAFPRPDYKADRLYAYETCDACAADELGYPIDGTLVSDFLYPAWFESFRVRGPAQFDRQRRIERPFQILRGGCALVYDVQTGTGYHQLFGDEAAAGPHQRPRVGSRHERRTTERLHWRLSRAHLRCGVERWPVKTLSDADAGQVAVGNAVPTTVIALRQTPRPAPIADPKALGPPNNRLIPVETTVYAVTATLVGAKVESDKDIHLVIADPTDPSATMIAEFPDPSCIAAADPALVSRMAAARQSIVSKLPAVLRAIAAGAPVPLDMVRLNPSTGNLGMALQPLSGTAQITGVGFFDTQHGQDGVAPNVIELHPVLDFTASVPPGP